MDEEKLANFLERSIPSYIDKVERRELDTADASRNFGNQLKQLKNNQTALGLQNKFNNQLRKRASRPNSNRFGAPGSPKDPNSQHPLQATESEAIRSETRVDSGELAVIIDGPSTIRANQSVSFSAKTLGIDGVEDYIWRTEGAPYGVLQGKQKGDDGSANKAYVVRTSADCQSGMIYIAAVGSKSGGVGALFVQILGDANKDNDSADKKDEAKKQAGGVPETTPEDGGSGDQEEAQDQQKKQNFLQDWAAKEYQKIIGNFLKKLLTKEFWAGVGLFLAANWYWVALFIVIVIAGYGIWAGLSQQAASGVAGSTIHQEVDLTKDTDLVEKTLLATGDTDAKAKIINKTFPDIQKQLLALKGSADPTTQGEIEQVSTKIDQYMSNNDPALGKEIIASVRDIMTALDLQAPVMQAQTRSPLDKITDYNFNLHYGTPLHKDVPKEGGHTTFMYSGEGKADAVDLYSDAGSAIYPAFPGKVIDLSDDGTGHKKVVIGNGDYQILYANFEPAKGLSLNQSLTTNTSIGKIVDIEGQTQVHIELAYQGKPIVTTALDQIDYKQSEKPWGQYLWDHMKKVLNLK